VTKQGYSLTKSIVGNQLLLSGTWTRGTTFEIVIPKTQFEIWMVMVTQTPTHPPSPQVLYSHYEFNPTDGTTDVDQTNR
jgi:hypothetical protein